MPLQQLQSSKSLLVTQSSRTNLPRRLRSLLGSSGDRRQKWLDTHRTRLRLRRRGLRTYGPFSLQELPLDNDPLPEDRRLF